MDGRSCEQCGKFPGCYVGRTRAREGRAPCLGWVAREFESETGEELTSGREFFERYGIPAAIPQGNGE